MQEINLMKKKAGSLLRWATAGTGVVLSNDNRRVTIPATGTAGVRSNLGKSSGKWYTEVKIIQTQSGWSGGAGPNFGIGSSRTPLDNPHNLGPDELMVYSWAPSNNVVIYGAGQSFAYNAYATAGAVVGIGLDMDNKTLRFYPSGTLANLIQLSTYSSTIQTFFLTASASAAGGTPAILDIPDTLVYPVPSGFQVW